MQGNNVCCVIGRIGADPEMKYLDSNKAIATFNVAVNRPVKDSRGNYITDWFTCEFWGKQAEVAGEWVKKGALVSVVGSIRIDKWEKDGEKKSKVVINGSSFQLLSSKGDNGSDHGEPEHMVNRQNAPRNQSQTRSAGKQSSADAFDFDEITDDIPPF